ncbi:serine hydrolase [Streptomyces sp. NBC_00385]|uniref:serine hydrolase n=1 Tax=Streptomyces sp. NBC_00385 TaxID=2975733 RepID=UPI002DDAE14A|nr:serine hydrolase [Streptomyces sp. NBC_00385]WRZ09094.1 serine hydrolase [Streptomyces sp. NBC_00385]
MAGESPDKSEQQKSSGTTRSETDPRLAVFREPASPAESGGGTDTATAVFRTQRSEPEGPEESDGAEGAEGSDGGEVGVAEGDGGADESADTSVGGSGPDESASDGSASDESEESDAVTPQEPEGAEGAEGVTEAVEGTESPAEAPEAAADAAEAPAESEEPVEAVEPSESAESAEGEEGEPAEPAEAAKDEPDEEPAEAAEPEEGDARLRAAVAAWVSKGDDAADGAAEPEAPAESEAPAASDGEDAAPEDDGTPTDTAETTDTADTDSADTDADTDAADTDDASETAADTASDVRVPRTREESGDEAQPAADTRGIDQATAVFKAPRLPRVDQPTTALKITPPPAEQKPKPGPETGAKPEAPAERTSKFVKLRADDVRPAPAPRTPEAAAPATPGAAQQQPAVSLSGAERTRQQPMPPRPPLDLLAELTNTPPPPETPVRTAVRRVKIWTPLAILLLIIFAVVQMVRPLPAPALTMTAESAYTFKGGDLNLSWPEQGQSAVTVDGVGSLGSAGAQKPAPIASVAKIMTAYVVLKEHPLTGKEQGEKITVDQQAEDESKLGDESTAPISQGQEFTEKQLLQLLMIPSGNNAARLFARWDSSETEFIAKMNAAAKDLGMTGTTYTDPSGLKKTTVSTAADQLKLARAVMQNEVFREIVDTPQIKIDGIDGTIYNNNSILLEPGVSGIKTGSSTPAGGNLVWSANTVVDGKTLWIYGAVMGQQAGTGQPYDSLVMSLNNSLKLIQDAQKAVTSATVVKKGDVVGYVDDGFGGHTPLVATGDLKAKGWAGLKIELSVKGDGEEISRSMKAGTKVGVVTVGTGPGRVSTPVALQEDLKDPGFGQKLTRIG